MTDRYCSLCGKYYIDAVGHDYNKCVISCKKCLERQKTVAHKALDGLVIAYEQYAEAQKIQAQDWWEK